MNSKPAPLPLVDDRPPIVQRAENILVWLREGNNGDVADIIVGLIGLVDQRADNLATLTAERDALKQERDAARLALRDQLSGIRAERNILENENREFQARLDNQATHCVELRLAKKAAEAQLAALTAEGVRLRAKLEVERVALEKLLLVGTQMSNLCYNLPQRETPNIQAHLTERDTACMRQLRSDWDYAIRDYLIAHRQTQAFLPPPATESPA